MMIESPGNRFTRYFAPLLDALRTADPTPLRPAAVRAWMMSNIEVPAEDLTRRIKQKGRESGNQSIFENDVYWAKFYLAKAGLITSQKRGLWSLTPEGRNAHLTRDEAESLCVRVRTASRQALPTDEDDIPAPEGDEDDGDGLSYWFVNSIWQKKDDQMHRFLAEQIWENGYGDAYADHVSRMKPGDRIAIKMSLVVTRGLPFDVGGKRVSVMRIKATGTILENLHDRRTVKVKWDPPFEPRDWYFYMYVAPVTKADQESENARRLIDFAFHGAPQEYTWFLAQPYWAEKYGDTQTIGLAEPAGDTAGTDEDDLPQVSEEPLYSTDDIVADGSFLSSEELNAILDRWRSKKNLVLQGPPGTGKTWLAKRLGFALVGSNDRETTRSRLRVVQFHPSLAYEDFVRGYRPSADGRLALVDGILMQAIEAAASEPDRPFVLVIEEINRGNPAQILGEMLTLLEDSKRRPSEAMELAYRKSPGERIHVPSNLYIIGTMNIADRSLAIVDLALRRRFAFIDLEPRLGPEWQEWCKNHGVDETTLAEIRTRIEVLNAEITAAVSLGPQFRLGHSFVTPDSDERIHDGRAWFRAKVETEIGPLLEEYWYDAPETAKAARAKLLTRLV